METPIRVVIADDNADMRRIERMMIGRAEGFEIVGEAEDGVQLPVSYTHLTLPPN